MKVARLGRTFAMPAAVALLVGCSTEEDSARLADAPACRLAEQAVPLPQAASEASGVAISRRTQGTLWTHNDSGHDPVLLAVDAIGSALGAVAVTGAENNDWEDLASGDCAGESCLYIGDIGDNAGNRNRIRVYRIPEPLPQDGTTSPAEAFDMRYPGGGRDAEALFVLPPERLFIVTKGSSLPIEIFEYPGPLRADEVVELRRVRALSNAPVPFVDLVTGAGANPGGTWVAIRTYTEVLLYPAEELLGTGNPTPISVAVGSVGEAQGEAVALADNGGLVLAGEGGGGGMPGSVAILWCDLNASDRATATGASAPQAPS